MSPTLTHLASAATGLLTGSLIICAIHIVILRRRLRGALRRAKNLRRQLQGAHHDATHDPLTGLPNRRALWAHLRGALRPGNPVAVVVLDIDGFKAVNDTADHHFGDLVLTEIAASLTPLPTPVTLVARLGGDEFALVLQGHTGDGWAAVTAARHAVARRVASPGGQLLTLTATAGAAVALPGEDAHSLLHRADAACMHAKRLRLGVHLDQPRHP